MHSAARLCSSPRPAQPDLLNICLRLHPFYPLLRSGKVYKALYNGEVVAVKEVNIEAGLASLAFITEASRLQTLRCAGLVQCCCTVAGVQSSAGS